MQQFSSLGVEPYDIEKSRFGVIEDNYYYLLEVGYELTDNYQKSVEEAHEKLGKGWRYLSLDRHEEIVNKELKDCR